MIVFYFGKMSILRAQYAEGSLSEVHRMLACLIVILELRGNPTSIDHLEIPLCHLVGFPENFFPSGEAIFPYTSEVALSSRQQMLL